MENSHTNPTMQPLPSRQRDFGWLRAVRLFLLIFAVPPLAGEVSRHLFPRFEPLVAYYLALFPCFCLWGRLEDRR